MIAARLVFGHLPDRLGGAQVAFICVFIEAAGLALIWLASGPIVAATGAVLTGFGYALVYPDSAPRPSAAPRRRAAAW